MGTLLESLTSLAKPAVGQIAARLGESESATSRGIQASVASVLGGLAGKTKDADFGAQIFSLITNAPPAAAPADPQALVNAAAGGLPKLGAAGTLLSTLFAGKPGSVGDLVTRTAGLKNPASGPALLGVAAPLVIDFLGKKVREGGLNPAGMASMIGAEREGIMAAAPAGLTNLFGAFTGAVRGEAGEMLRGVTTASRSAVGPVVQKGNRWMWPLLTAVAAVLVYFAVRGRNPGPSAPTAVGAGASTAVQAGEAVKTAAGEVAEVAKGLGAMVSKALPGGATLSIPEYGIESKVVAFIENPSLPVTDTTWFDFDRLNFASGSATILPESREQVSNIAAIMKAYPKVNVKIGGYTDDVGSAASNLKLSQQRADAVMKALVDAGIPASRLQAEGYGDKHPVADNATEEGRARNRRIALKVTKK